MNRQWNKNVVIRPTGGRGAPGLIREAPESSGALMQLSKAFLRTTNWNNVEAQRFRGFHEDVERHRPHFPITHFFKQIIGVLVAILAMSSIVFAQQPNIIIEPALRQPVVAVGRPMLTWWDVKISGPGLVVGQFQFVIRHDQNVLGRFQTEEMSLNGPEQRIRVLLPAVDSLNTVDQLTVDISFEGKKFSAKLGEHILRCPMVAKKSLLALVAETKGASTMHAPNVTPTERLKFELIAAKADRLRETDVDMDFVKTIFGSIDATDFPADPLSYCGFDMVALPGQEFRSLRRQQLDALLAWVKSGGSLFVEAHGVLEKFHVDFLRSLAGDNPLKVEFELDPAGKLPSESIPGERELATLDCGLGVAILRVSDADLPKEEFNSEWSIAVGNLWKIRNTPQEMPPQARRFVVGKDGRPVLADAKNPDPYGLSMSLFNRHEPMQSDLLDRIMPKGVRMVPAWVLALILFTFILMIGPVDYFVLGWLRVRKLTWLTFPLATIAATAFTFRISNSYMSASETLRAVVIHDLDDANDIVRTNRFDLLYVSNSRRLDTQVEKGLFTSLTSSPGDNRFMAPPMAAPVTPMLANVTGTVNMRGMSPAATPWAPVFPSKLQMEITGRIPTQYTISQNLPKWTPQLNRIFSIPLSPAKSEIDWSEFDLSLHEMSKISGQMVPRDLIDRVKSQFGREAMVACFTGPNGCAYDGSVEWRSNRTEIEQQISRQRLMRRGLFFAVEPQNINAPGFVRWLFDASVIPPSPGLFSLVKQTAPMGSASCEDLPMLDATDSASWLLVVVVPDTEGYQIYRKKMRATPTE